MSSPRVSIVLPVFDVAPWLLDEAIGSILNQTFRDFELVIGDDGSTDAATIRTLEKFAREDSRVRLLREAHRGAPGIMNHGMKASRGEFVARHDADDWSEPDRLEKQVKFLDEHPQIGVVGSAVLRHQEDGTRLWRSRYPSTPAKIRKALEAESPFCHGAVMFRRTQALEIGGYHEAFVVSEDYEFFWRFCPKFGGANLPEVLYHYRYCRGSLSTLRPMEQVIMGHCARRMKSPGDLAAVRIVVEENLKSRGIGYENRFWPADHLLLAGDNRRALQGYLHGVMARPFRPTGWAKLLRWLLFIPLPPARRLLYESFPKLMTPLFRPTSRTP